MKDCQFRPGQRGLVQENGLYLQTSDLMFKLSWHFDYVWEHPTPTPLPQNIVFKLFKCGSLSRRSFILPFLAYIAWASPNSLVMYRHVGGLHVDIWQIFEVILPNSFKNSTLNLVVLTGITYLMEKWQEIRWILIEFLLSIFVGSQYNNSLITCQHVGLHIRI